MTALLPIAGIRMGEFSRDPQTRRCSKCGDTKPARVFARNRTDCRECRGNSPLHALPPEPDFLNDGEPNCTGGDPDLWFSDDLDDIWDAATECATCPLMDACRAWGAEHATDGVWGGAYVTRTKGYDKSGLALHARRVATAELAVRSAA